MVEGTLDECIGQFLAKPAEARHLYEIQTSPQAPLVDAVVAGEISLNSPTFEIFSERWYLPLLVRV